MDKINLNEMADFLLTLDSASFPDRESALHFLSSVSAVVDREASGTKNPGEVHIEIGKVQNNPTFTLGLMPTEKLIEVTSASTAVPTTSVARIIGELDQQFFKLRLLDVNVKSTPLSVEGFGTFENTGTELIFKPTAFEYLQK